VQFEPALHLEGMFRSSLAVVEAGQLDRKGQPNPLAIAPVRDEFASSFVNARSSWSATVSRSSARRRAAAFCAQIDDRSRSWNTFAGRGLRQGATCRMLIVR